MAFSKRYKVSTVVGGFHGLKKDEVLPFSILRSLIEHEQLRNIIRGHKIEAKSSVEFGCGFGRMLWSLPGRVYGYEREAKLRRVARKLNPSARITDDWREVPDVDLLVTFTFLQHLTEDEWKVWMGRISAVNPTWIILCEQTEGDSRHCHGRTPSQYEEKLLPGYTLVATYPRLVDHASISGGHYMVFRRIEA